MDWKAIPSLAALRAFEALVRHGSQSAAARDLNVTHAAISQHLRALEAEFGEELATRVGQGMEPTPAGRALAEALGDGFARIAQGVAQLRASTASRPVVVTLTPSFAEAWLMPRIGAFWAAHPDIELRLSPAQGLVDMQRDGIDVAIRFGAGAWPGVEAEPFALNKFVVIAAPGFTKARRLSDLGQLTAHDWFFSRASGEQRIWGAAVGVDFDQIGARELANNGMVVSAVRAGLGLSIQAKALVEPDIASGQLVALYEGDAGALGYHIVTRPGFVTPGAQAFITWLRKAVRREAKQGA